jgi:hypothetical protein
MVPNVSLQDLPSPALMLVDHAQVVLDDPFGNGVRGGFMTGTRTFFYGLDFSA